MRVAKSRILTVAHFRNENASGIVDGSCSHDQFDGFAQHQEISAGLGVRHRHGPASLDLLLKQRANTSVRTQDISEPHRVHLCVCSPCIRIAHAEQRQLGNPLGRSITLRGLTALSVEIISRRSAPKGAAALANPRAEALFANRGDGIRFHQRDML